MLKICMHGLLAVGLAVVLSPGALAYTGAYTPGTGINNTPHDLGVAPGTNGMLYPENPTDTLSRKCIWCHAPHNTYKLAGTAAGGGIAAPDAVFSYLPLWNHSLTGARTSFTLYTNGTGPLSGPKALQAPSGTGTPGSTSLLCLSCHDGSIAVNAYGSSSWQPSGSVSSGGGVISAQYQIGTGGHLGNHHPIGFNYGAVQAVDTEIRDADLWLMTPTEFISSYLSNGVMECSTCHSVHNTGNGGEALLWRSDQNSQLCLTCHDKGLYTAP